MIYLVKSIAKLKGFTTIELIFSLLIILTILPMNYLYLNSISFLSENIQSNQEDMVAIYQLRIYLACNNIIEVNQYSLSIQTKDSKLTLKEINEKLMLLKGSLTFLTNVSDINFYQEDDSIYINYLRNGKEYVYWIAAY